MQQSDLITLILWVQGLYFTLTGVWPILHYRSFAKITGPKTDVWLVKTVGALVTVTGLLLLVAALYKDVHTSTIIAGMGAAFALLMIDVIYVAKKVIRPIYLGDAVIELALIVIWGFTLI